MDRRLFLSGLVATMAAEAMGQTPTPPIEQRALEACMRIADAAERARCEELFSRPIGTTRPAARRAPAPAPSTTTNVTINVPSSGGHGRKSRSRKSRSGGGGRRSSGGKRRSGRRRRRR